MSQAARSQLALRGGFAGCVVYRGPPTDLWFIHEVRRFRAAEDEPRKHAAAPLRSRGSASWTFHVPYRDRPLSFGPGDCSYRGVVNRRTCADARRCVPPTRVCSLDPPVRYSSGATLARRFLRQARLGARQRFAEAGKAVEPLNPHVTLQRLRQGQSTSPQFF